VLENLLDDPNLFDEKRFAHVTLSEETKKLIGKKPNPLAGSTRIEKYEQDLRYLNRLLLEEAYPEAIAKSHCPIIYKGPSRRTTNPGSRQPKHHEIPYFITVNLLVL
jgi:hypothetical protein